MIPSMMNMMKKYGFMGGMIILGVIVGVIAGRIVVMRAIDKKNNEVHDIVVQAMEPVAMDPFVYQFETIDWVFTPTSEQGVGVPLTHVALWLKDFSRNPGFPVVFEKPFKLGTYAGDCVSRDTLAPGTISGIPVAFAQCTQNDQTIELGVFQQGTMISFAKRDRAESENFVTLYSIDMTSIVRE